jgi:serine/threonine protein kinase
MTERHATQEYEEINSIKEKLDSIPNYREYFLLNNVSLCRPAKLTATDLEEFSEKCTALPKDDITKTNINKKLNSVMALNLPNGGIPIDDYIYENGNYAKLFQTHKALVDLLKKGIIPMNKKNIYHSDIKDSNILIDEDGGNLKARLIDWGLSVEYVPDSDVKFPKNWRNRPLQFNVPFSVIIFTDTFYENYSKYLDEGGVVDEGSLRPFVINYINEWIKERGSGHYKFINEIMYLLYSSELTSISDGSKPNVVETEITMPYIIDYIIDVLVHYTKFKSDGKLNLREYLDDVYIKIVDIWGFITSYYPYLEMFSNNYFSLDKKQLKIFKQLQYIFNQYLYTPRHEPIDTSELLNDLKTLGNLIHIVAHGKKKTTSTRSSKILASGINTRKNTSIIFKRKALVKRFNSPFLLSIK